MNEVKNAENKSVNKREVKDAKNETQDEEPLVTDNSAINAPNYFRLFKWGEKLLNKLDATCEWACMTNSKDKYYTEFCDTITDYNYRKQVMR